MPPRPSSSSKTPKKGKGSAKPKFTRRDFMRWTTGGAVSAIAPFAYANRSIELITVEERELKVPNWDADGFRVILLSDVHMSSPKQFRIAMDAAKIAKHLDGDVILVPGDFVDSSTALSRDYIRAFCNRLGNSKIPAFATMGNHDYATADPGSVIREIRKSPMRLLQNEVAEVRGVSIAGIDDALAGQDQPEVLEPGKYSRSLLAMLHEPDYVKRMPDHVSLQVSGHSHGGQICLPFGIAVHTPFGARDYIDGFYPDAKVPLFVTRGIGTTGPPYRLFCRPQIAVLTIRQA